MGKPHHRLDVWKKAIGFVKKVYEITGGFPAEEKFGLVSQMRRAAWFGVGVSVKRPSIE